MTLRNQRQQDIQQQAGKVLSQVAGYVGVRTIEIGLRFGLFEEIGKHAKWQTAANWQREWAWTPVHPCLVPLGLCLRGPRPGRT